MYSEALARLHDSELLARSLEAQSDSASIIRILGFEVLLKCALVLCGITPRRSHKYEALWQDLPAAAQEEILGVARNRMPGMADLSDVRRLMLAYQYVFEKGRYFYELYEGWTLKEQQDFGALWDSLGAPINEADIQYHPNEMTCLIDGLKAFIEGRLSNSALRSFPSDQEQ